MMDRYNDKCLKTINFFNYEQKCFGTLPVQVLEVNYFNYHEPIQIGECLNVWFFGILVFYLLKVLNLHVGRFYENGTVFNKQTNKLEKKYISRVYLAELN